MFWRLFGAYSVLVLNAIGVLGALVVHRVEQHEMQQIQDNLQTRAVLVREIVHDLPSGGATSLQRRLQSLREEIAMRITLVDASGRVLADTDEEPDRMANHAGRPEFQQAAAQGFGTDTRMSATLHQWMIYRALRVDGGAGGVAYVRVALPLGSVHERLAELHRIVWTAAGLTALAALLLAFWLARRITRPIQDLTAGAAHIAAGGYGYTVYALGKDEVGTAARAFNHMSERLAVQFAQLEEDRQQLRAVLSGMIEGVVALDADQRILFANERAQQLLEFPPSSVGGRKLWEVVRQRSVQEVVERALAQAEPQREELDWHGPTGRSLAVYASRLPGTPARGAVLVLHDTSDLRRLERLRQEFVANVSHELKTPLSVIKAAVETLLDGAVDDPANRGAFLEQIEEQSDRLYALILDLLSLARLESGTEGFELQAVPLVPLIEGCLDRHHARAEARHQQLEIVPPSFDTETRRQADKETGRQGNVPSPCLPVSLSPCLDLAVWADEEAVEQIVDNLVDNALKYTPEGGRICVRWSASDGQVCLEVEDTGIGIPERDLPRIFERFYRVDKARSRELGGTGLGLSIVKHLVQAMQGTIRAASQPGQGTTFTVRLPRAPAQR
jgi:two-component system, OmpR family, phosphate regulon sensor histidine kinase PhoR